MNPMIAALQKSRAADPEGPGRDLGVGGAPAAPAPEAAGPGDALLEKLASLEAKVDKICAAMNLNGDAGHEPSEKDGTEAPPNDDGY